MKVCGAALICVAAAAIIKKINISFAKPVLICTAVVIAAAVIYKIKPAAEYVTALSEAAGIGGYLIYVFKAIALVYISEFTFEICREADAPLLGRTVTAFARAEILIVSLPLLQELIDFALSLC